MKLSQQSFTALFLCMLHPASTFTISRPAGRSMVPRRSSLTLGMSTDDSADADATTTFRKSLKAFSRDVHNGKSGDLRPAIQLLTGNPSVSATIEDAKDLLNGVPQVLGVRASEIVAGQQSIDEAFAAAIDLLDMKNEVKPVLKCASPCFTCYACTCLLLFLNSCPKPRQPRH
jgi:hypothetical protein